METETLRLEIRALPGMRRISSARRVVDDLASQFVTDEDVVWRLAMATHELLENAFRYGQGDIVTFTLEIESINGVRVAGLRVSNRSTPQNISTLRVLAQAIHSTKDPWAYYLEAMKSLLGRSHGSGLGLARIWAEGEMALDIKIDGDIVSIEAQLPLGGTS